MCLVVWVWRGGAEVGPPHVQEGIDRGVELPTEVVPRGAGLRAVALPDNH